MKDQVCKHKKDNTFELLSTSLSVIPQKKLGNALLIYKGPPIPNRYFFTLELKCITFTKLQCIFDPTLAANSKKESDFIKLIPNYHSNRRGGPNNFRSHLMELS